LVLEDSGDGKYEKSRTVRDELPPEINGPESLLMTVPEHVHRKIVLQAIVKCQLSTYGHWEGKHIYFGIVILQANKVMNY
jgi:hypothetical protein